MKNLVTKKSCLWLLFILLIALTAVLQIVAVVTVYEGETHYFRTGSILPKLSVFSALLAALCGTLAAAKTDLSSLSPTPFSKKNTISPLFFGFLAVTVLMIASRKAIDASLGVVAILSAVASLPYTVLIGIPTARKKATSLTLWGFAPVVASILLLAYFYFDNTLEMNAPLKVSVQIGLLMIPLLMTGELRYLIGREQPRLFMMLATWTASVGALASPSVLVAFFIDKASRIEYVAGALLAFCASITALSRIRNLTLTKENIAEESAPLTHSDSEKEEDKT